MQERKKTDNPQVDQRRFFNETIVVSGIKAPGRELFCPNGIQGRFMRQPIKDLAGTGQVFFISGNYLDADQAEDC